MDQFLFLACDGIFDVVDGDFVADFLQSKLSESNSEPGDLARVCDELVALALDRGSEDNLTAVLVCLREPLCSELFP